MKLAIQGVKASFHHEAAQKFFPGESLELAECPSFRRLAQSLSGGETDVAIMAIENTIAGSILPNYILLEEFKFQIIGEVYLRIEMNLMALAGQKISELSVVQSHPMALLQCQEFLAHHPHLKVIETDDTAESAKDIKEKNLRGFGAIASRLAASTYDLELLQTGIETNRQNYTRFLVVKKDAKILETPNKASIRFEISHRPGSLLSILSSFTAHGINMTKLQSVPILGKPYEYSFHADLEWEDYEEYQKALKELKLKALALTHYGEYRKAERP